MSGGGRIDYEQLTQDAMRSIVRTVLNRTAKAGLPGEHHFYISFDTRARGVTLSRRLKEKYPEEMTIVLQHRFSDLIISDDRFEVKLTFDNIPERLVVPFLAIKVFFDPSVHFGLQFDSMEQVADGDGPMTDTPTARPSGGPTRLSGAGGGPKPRLATARKPKAPRRPNGEPDDAAAETAGETATGGIAGNDKTRVRPFEREKASSANEAAPAPADGGAQKPVVETDGQTAPPAGGAEIVRLDQFRKK